MTNNIGVVCIHNITNTERSAFKLVNLFMMGIYDSILPTRVSRCLFLLYPLIDYMRFYCTVNLWLVSL